MANVAAAVDGAGDYLFDVVLMVAAKNKAAPAPSPQDSPAPAPISRKVFDVGVIPGGTACANGADSLEIMMDDSDFTKNSAVTDWTGGIYVDGHKNTHFFFCKVDGTKFKPYTNDPNQKYEYAVIKLGTDCPNGSVEFGRYFDNQDGYSDEEFFWTRWVSNANWYRGDISPNWQNRHGTMLRFCLFRYGTDTLLDSASGQVNWPDLGFSYGVFAGKEFPAAAHGTVFTDDQNGSGKESHFEIPASLDASSVYGIVDGYPHSGDDTTLRTAQVRYQ